jgi:mRNA-degrading endonuclease RelE of RelBE toxin-antitoxin system
VSDAKFQILFTDQARDDLKKLEDAPALAKRLRAVRKALGLLSRDTRHPSLKTHEYTAFSGPNGQKIFEAYAENQTPAAYRIFWYYGSTNQTIVVVAITPHP